MKKTRKAVRLLLLLFIIPTLLTAAAGSFLLRGALAEGANQARQILSLKIKWVTTDNDGDESRLYLRRENDPNASISMQYQIDLILTGHEPHEPGTVRILVPKQIFHQRSTRGDGSVMAAGYGGFSCSVLDAPSENVNWHWEDAENGQYAIVNDVTIDAAAQVMFQASITNLKAYDLVDMLPSDALKAEVKVTSRSTGDVLDTMTSGELRAVVNTRAALDVVPGTSFTGAKLSGTVYTTSESISPNITERVPGGPTKANQYIYVCWHTEPQYTATQYFNLDVDLWAGEAVGNGAAIPGIALGRIRGGGSVTTQNSGTQAGQHYTCRVADYIFDEQESRQAQDIWVAYPVAQMQANKTYSITASAEWKLTEADPARGSDLQEVSQAGADATAEYLHSGWSFPEGSFGVYKFTDSHPSHTHNIPARDRPDGSVYTSYHKKQHTYEMAVGTLRKGQSVTMEYEVLTAGYGYSYTAGPTGEVPDLEEDWEYNPDHYLNWNYMMETTDDEVRFPQPDIGLQSGDYCFDGITIAAPEMFTYGKQADSYYRLPGSEYGYKPDKNLTKPAVEIWIEKNRSGNWELYQTITEWRGGTEKITFPDSVTGYQTRILTNQAACKLAVWPKITLFPTAGVLAAVEDMVDRFTNVVLENNVRLKTTYYYSAERTDEVLPSQTAWLEAAREADHMLETADSSEAVLTAAGFRVSGTTYTVDGVENDQVNRRVKTTIMARVDEQSNVTGESKYNQAIEMGVVVPETSGTWYVLLPEHVTVNASRIRLRERGDRVTSAEILENYRGSGRTLVKVEAELKPDPSYYNTGGAADSIRLYLDVYLAWEDYCNLTDEQKKYLDYYVAFESGNPGKLGNLEPNSMYQYAGYPDEWPPKGTSYLSTTITESIRSLMTDLDPNTDEERFVYARSGLDFRNIDVSEQVEFRKDARSDSEGFWGRGTENETQVTVTEGGEYTYRLTVSSKHDSKTAGIILYDAIEEHVPDNETGLAAKKNWYGKWNGKGQWQGTLTSVDISELTAMGCAPKLYYSEVPGLKFGRQGSVDPEDQYIFDTRFVNWDSDYNLYNETVWKPVKENKINQGVWNVPEDTHVTAIAVDAQKSTRDAAYFPLSAGKHFSVYLHMKAPDDGGNPGSWNAKGAYAHKTNGGSSPDNIDWLAAQDPDNNMYAYNAATVVFVPFSAPVGSAAGQIQKRQVLNFQYDRVGIVPETITVRKIWKDSAYLSGTGNIDNYDGLRPDRVTVRLKGVTGSSASPVIEDSLVLSADNDWEGVFLNAPEQDSAGNRYVYTVTEDPVPGYTAKITQASALNRRSYEIVNTHEKESVDITIRKLWLNPDGTSAEPPNTGISIYLSQTGKDGLTGHEFRFDLNRENDWTLTRALDRYEAHGFEFRYAFSRESGAPGNWFGQDQAVPAGVTVTAEYDPDDFHTFRNFKKPDFGYAMITTHVEDSSKPREGNNTELPSFPFVVNLYQGDGTTPLAGEYEYVLYSKAPYGYYDTALPADAVQIGSGTVRNGGMITLAPEQCAVIIGIPDGSRGKVTEQTIPGWTPDGRNNYMQRFTTGGTTKFFITNAYKAKGPVEVGGTKELAGREQRAGEFTFEVTDHNEYDRWNNANDDYGKVIATVRTGRSRGTVTGAGGTVTGLSLFSFSPDFDNNELNTIVEYGGTRTLKYTIREKLPAGAQTVNGAAVYNDVTYDSRVIQVNVILTDQKDGKLKVTVTTQNGGTPVFRNTYSLRKDITLTAHKELVGRTLQPEEFSFEVRRSGAAANTAPLATGKNGADGSVTFTPDITLTERDLASASANGGIAEVAFLISEVQGTDPTVAYMTSPAEAKVQLAQKSDGALLVALPGQTLKHEQENCPACGGDGRGGLAAVVMDTQTHSVSDIVMLNDYWNEEHLEICPDCHGNGFDPLSPGDKCSSCKGVGFELRPCTHPNQIGETCPDCLNIFAGQAIHRNGLVIGPAVGGYTLSELAEMAQVTAASCPSITTYAAVAAYAFTEEEWAYLQQHPEKIHSALRWLVAIYPAETNDSCTVCAGTGKVDGELYVDGDPLPVPLMNRIKTGVSLTAIKTMEGQPASAPFDFVLLETDGNGETIRELETARNGTDGTITFSAVELDPNDSQPHYYMIREVPGTDSTILYDESTVRYRLRRVISPDGSSTTEKTLLSEDNAIRNRYRDGSLAITVTSGGYAPHFWLFRPLFPVTVTLKDRSGKPMANQTFTARMETRKRGPATASAHVTDSEGRMTLLIEGGRTAVIPGLPHGASYKVEQPAASMPAGFTQSAAKGATGVIRGGTESQASFENAYDSGGQDPDSPTTPPDPKPVPKTGDPSSPLLWLGMVLLGLFGICIPAVLTYGKKK